MGAVNAEIVGWSLGRGGGSSQAGCLPDILDAEKDDAESLAY